jgi:hypothetical protein
MLGKADEAQERSEKPDQQSEHRDNQEHCSDPVTSAAFNGTAISGS